ncbi:hypothetical protein DFJ73DRAFT_8751 [Zopfochytrium polystomum]|nr:hypothetical protein DFJ73DRAFT_8751 [Zopfochytrium polystomum]
MAETRAKRARSALRSPPTTTQAEKRRCVSSFDGDTAPSPPPPPPLGRAAGPAAPAPAIQPVVANDDGDSDFDDGGTTAVTAQADGVAPPPPPPAGVPRLVPAGRLVVAHRRTQRATLAARFPGCAVLDVTSKGPAPWVRFSPFYPIGGSDSSRGGGIAVPTDPGVVSVSVEGIWQALKVFANEGPDASKLRIATMAGLKRGASKARGRVLGHSPRLAVQPGDKLLAYVDARRRIYLPAYREQLERLAPELEQVRRMAIDAAQTVVLLDFETNTDVADTTRPLSHAGLIKVFLETGELPLISPN